MSGLPAPRRDARGKAAAAAPAHQQQQGQQGQAPAEQQQQQAGGLPGDSDFLEAASLFLRECDPEQVRRAPKACECGRPLGLLCMPVGRQGGRELLQRLLPAGG